MQLSKDLNSDMWLYSLCFSPLLCSSQIRGFLVRNEGKYPGKALALHMSLNGKVSEESYGWQDMNLERKAMQDPLSCDSHLDCIS